MSFLKHTNCTKCGSSDGLALYSDGSTYCFVCKYYRRRTRRVIGSQEGENKNVYTETRDSPKSLPDDCSSEIFPEALEWLRKYGITAEDIIRSEILSSKSQRRLFFCFKDQEGILRGWQSRNFIQGIPKYSSSGCFKESSILYSYISRPQWYNSLLYRDRNNLPLKHVCLVEDCVSAIRVSKTGLADASPCLTSSLPFHKLKALAGLYEAFTVWLDGDMYPNAQKMVRQLQLLGKEAKAVWTPEDPKCYAIEQIRNILDKGRLM